VCVGMGLFVFSRTGAGRHLRRKRAFKGGALIRPRRDTRAANQCWFYGHGRYARASFSDRAGQGGVGGQMRAARSLSPADNRPSVNFGVVVGLDSSTGRDDRFRARAEKIQWVGRGPSAGRSERAFGHDSFVHPRLDEPLKSDRNRFATTGTRHPTDPRPGFLVPCGDGSGWPQVGRQPGR